MIDLFIKLVEKGIELIKERRERRKSFFDNVIAKQHEVFEKMCSQHLETFVKTQEMLMSNDVSESQILKYVESKILFESGTIGLLKRVVDSELLEDERIRPVVSRYTSQSEEYERYLALISTCILSPMEPVELEDEESAIERVAFYDSLHTLIDLLAQGWSREKVLEGLEQVVIRFNNFYAEVQSSFFRLRGEYIN